jgi:hypothetical protein
VAPPVRKSLSASLTGDQPSPMKRTVSSAALMAPPTTTPTKVTKLSVENLQSHSDGFDFQEPVREADAMSGLSGVSGSSTASGGCGGASSSYTVDDGSGVCKVCDDMVGFGIKSKFCPIHRRAHDSISRQALKGIRMDPATKQPIETDQSLAYKQVFGHVKKGQVTYEGDAAIAARVILDFCEQFPEGKEKSTKQRGPITLSRYVHEQGNRIEDQMVSERPLWDYELFETQLCNLRRWKPQKCKHMWDTVLKPEPTCKGDNGGPPDAPLRLRIPAWLIGGDKESHVEMEYEDKKLINESKSTKMAGDVQKQILRETKSGFTRNDSAISSIGNAALYNLLPANALTQESEGAVSISGMDILLRSTEPSASHGSGVDSTGDDTPASTADQQMAATSVERAKKAKEQIPVGENTMVDIKSYRNTAKVSVKSLLDKSLKKLDDVTKSVRKAFKVEAELEDPAFYDTLVERWVAALMVMGARPKAFEQSGGGEAGREGKKWDCAADVVQVDFESELKDFTAPADSDADEIPTSPSALQNYFLKCMFQAMEWAPVEDSSALLGKLAMQEKHAGIATLASVPEVESVQEVVLRWVQLVNQLIKSLVTAASDYTKQVKKRSSEDDKKIKDLRDKEAKDEIDKTKQEEADAKRSIAKIKATNNFGIDWTAYGHSCIRVLDCSSSATHLKSDAEFNQPTIFKGLASAAALVAADTNFEKALARWSQDSISRLQKKPSSNKESAASAEATLAPMMPSHGAPEFEQLFACIIPPNTLLPDTLPSLRNIQKPWFFTLLKSAIYVGPEADYVASIRFVCRGQLRYLMAPAKMLYDALPAIVKNKCDTPTGRNVALEQMKNMLKPTEASVIQKMAESGVIVFQGIVNQGGIILCPAGFIAAWTPTDDDVVGVKRSFLQKSAIGRANLEAMNTVTGSQLLGGYLDFLSVTK